MPAALVLSAGGLWAAWEVGVWKALRTHFHPDLIAGASAGSWNGWAIASGCTPEELEQLWLEPRTSRIIQLGLHRSGVLRPAALYECAHDLFDRFHPRIPFGLTVVEVPALRSKLVRQDEITWRHLAASCTIPFGFPPVRIDGRSYVDGGLLGGLPLWAAEQMGATCAVALNVLSTLPFRIARRVLWLRRPSPALRVICLEPSVRLGSLRQALAWSEGNIRRWIELGERDGTRAVTSITM